jgi:xanthine dehydrogenase accessory factor
VKLEILERLVGRTGPLVLVTRLDDGRQVLVDPAEPSPELEDWTVDNARRVLAADRSSVVERDGARYFFGVFNTQVRVLVVGAVHIAQLLASMARSAGYRVVVIDPRRAFATADRFPGTTLDVASSDEALARHGIDARTAIVTLTHDPRLDDPALQVALRSSAFYIGALGGQRTHEARFQRLREAGFDDDDLARIKAPIGLPIGSRTAGEIAASILAEIVQTLRLPAP